jgi:ferric-dicitrate binding protein FerR (iron transport regulator)
LSAEPGEGERELERWLRELPPERPDPLRREAARLAFLRARSRPAGAARREAVRHAAGPGEDEAESAFAAWLALHGEGPPPAEAFRRRARLALLSALALEARPERRSTRPFRLGVWLAAAAAIAFVTFLLPEPERWSARLDGPVRFAGEDYGAEEGGRLSVALEGSGTLEGLARVHVALAGELELELQPGSELAFPVLPELDGLAPLDFGLARGEVFVRTRPGYPGNPLTIRTGEAEILLHGTTVGVRADEQGTCVCVAEGTARVRSALLAEAREVGPRATLLLLRAPGMGPKAEAFPPDGAPGAAHTRPLLEFLRRP